MAHSFQCMYSPLLGTGSSMEEWLFFNNEYLIFKISKNLFAPGQNYDKHLTPQDTLIVWSHAHSLIFFGNFWGLIMQQSIYYAAPHLRENKKFSRTFHKSSKFGPNFRAISRKFLDKTTFLYSFFQNIKFENFRAEKF